MSDTEDTRRLKNIIQCIRNSKKKSSARPLTNSSLIHCRSIVVAEVQSIGNRSVWRKTKQIVAWHGDSGGGGIAKKPWQTRCAVLLALHIYTAYTQSRLQHQLARRSSA
uniref:Uncharacterized protein n=1 Tax=Trichogramma kaykai TaxID=54128 RepID=A0ABD2X785_9HYME